MNILKLTVQRRLLTKSRRALVNARWLVIPLACLPFALSQTGCGKQDFREFSKEKEEALRLYCSEDVRVAAKAMEQHRDYLRGRMKTDATGVDYAAALSEAECQSFILYQVLGDSGMADRYYTDCTNHLAQKRLGWRTTAGHCE